MMTTVTILRFVANLRRLRCYDDDDVPFRPNIEQNRPNKCGRRFSSRNGYSDSITDDKKFRHIGVFLASLFDSLRFNPILSFSAIRSTTYCQPLGGIAIHGGSIACFFGWVLP